MLFLLLSFLTFVITISELYQVPQLGVSLLLPGKRTKNPTCAAGGGGGGKQAYSCTQWEFNKKHKVIVASLPVSNKFLITAAACQLFQQQNLIYLAISACFCHKKNSILKPLQVVNILPK